MMFIRRIEKNQHISDILAVMDGDGTNKGMAINLRTLADELDKIQENIPF